MPKTRRSNQGRGNAKKRGQTAGKGFVAPRATRSDKKAIGKTLATAGSLVVPYGGMYKAAKAANALRKVKKSTQPRVLNKSGKTFDQITDEAIALANSGRAKPTSAQVQKFMADLKNTGVANIKRNNVTDIRAYKKRRKKKNG